jgi:uncharacterized Zn finger protein
MSFYDWKPYVSAAERRKKARNAAARARKRSADLSPVAAARGVIAKTFWGRAWCDNLERYSDFANRLPRGRTYLRNGSVIDLKITAGEVQAQVVGSRLYKVAVRVIAVPGKQWQAISADCAGSINSLVELLQGRLSTAVMQRICTRDTGLFPAPKEIQFSCSCPDWASMCKHVAAVLYGVGVRLDEQPELIFTLRRVEAHDLVTRAGAGLPRSKRSPTSGKVLDDAVLGDVFGIEMAEIAPVTKPAAVRTNATATKVAAKTAQKASTVRKTEATRKMAQPQKSLKAKLPAAPFARANKPTTSKANPRVATTVSKGKVATGHVLGRLAKAKSR